MSTHRLAAFLDGVTVGEPQIYENMRIFPLHAGHAGERAYRTLDEALKLGAIEIKEVSQGGSVPTLAVKNTGTLPVLMVVGEELVGAKQNRVLNTSVLVPAETETNIPVSCVERGRWAYKSEKFDSSVTTSHLNLRKAQTENVTSNLRTKATYDADQGAVWAEVERKFSAHSSSSQTRALNEIYQQNEEKLKGYLDGFKVPDAEGILIEINGKVVGGDMFDSKTTLQTLWAKLLRSYALDALEKQAKAPHAVPSPAGEKVTEPLPTLAETQEFLSAAKQAAEEVYDAVGLGEDVRLSSAKVNGSGLLFEDKLVHASLFAATV